MDDASWKASRRERRAGSRGWSTRFPKSPWRCSTRRCAATKSGRGELYNWFLPLLRLDTVPKFVQYIKWVQAEVGRGTYVVRAPRLPLDGRELDDVKGILAQALKARPAVRR